jgi:glycosyltransferase involved in cell wall biosynthesis
MSSHHLAGWQAHLLRRIERRMPISGRKDAERHDDPLSILVIDRGVPTPDRDSGSHRMFQLLATLTQHEFDVAFLPADLDVREPYAQRLAAIGVRLLVDGASAEDLVAGLGRQPDIVIVSRPEVACRLLPYVRAYAPLAKVVYDTVDVHWRRFELGGALGADDSFAHASRTYRAMERVCALGADMVFAVSAEDAACLQSEMPSLAVAVVPNVHEVTRPIPPLSRRRDLLFVGGFLHHPNVDAVVWFVNDILPRVRQRMRDAKLVVVGSDMPAAITGLASEGVRVVGYVPNLSAHLGEARVFVAPLRYGAGLKGKVGASLAAGLPVVTTSIGAQGFGLDHGRDALIADAPSDFADGVVRLLRDDQCWHDLSRAGVEIIEQRFTPQVVGRGLAGVLRALAAGGFADA